VVSELGRVDAELRESGYLRNCENWGKNADSDVAVFLQFCSGLDRNDGH